MIFLVGLNRLVSKRQSGLTCCTQHSCALGFDLASKSYLASGCLDLLVAITGAINILVY